MKYGKAKILFLDIETAPNLVANWGCGYKLTVGPDSIVQERYIISAQWSWNNDKTVHGILGNIKKADDRNVIKKLTRELSKADAIVGHNIKKFDARWIEGRAMINGLPPTGAALMPTFDTMSLAKKVFYLNSYKLDYIAKKLGIGQKVKTEYNDWMKVLVNKDLNRAKFLLEYGKHDVSLNRKVFEKLLPYVRLPMLLGTLISGKKHVCSCGSTNLSSKGTRIARRSGIVYQRRVCNDCGSCDQIPKKEGE
jgi:DNA polymerase elongation subunit (family B)